MASFLLPVMYFDEQKYFLQGYSWIPLPCKQTKSNQYKKKLYFVRKNKMLFVEPIF